PCLLHVDGQADAAAVARARIDRRLLGARARVVESSKQLVEQRRKVAGVIDRRDTERLRPAVVGHLVRANEIAATQLGRIQAQSIGARVEQPRTAEVALRSAARSQRAGPGL